jgi:hypothetical protein
VVYVQNRDRSNARDIRHVPGCKARPSCSSDLLRVTVTVNPLRTQQLPYHPRDAVNPSRVLTLRAMEKDVQIFSFTLRPLRTGSVRFVPSKRFVRVVSMLFHGSSRIHVHACVGSAQRVSVPIACTEEDLSDLRFERSKNCVIHQAAEDRHPGPLGRHVSLRRSSLSEICWRRLHSCVLQCRQGEARGRGGNMTAL